MNSDYKNNLKAVIIDNSESEDWYSSVKEWEFFDVEEDEFCNSTCVCGHPNIKYLFTIRNKNNGNFVVPIGSHCIKKFDRADLNELVDVKEQLFKLLHAVENREYITLSSGYFSRKLLKYLYEEGAFIANKYNNYDAKNDYKFMLSMFNARSQLRDSIVRRINAIMINSIIPFLKDNLKQKKNGH